MIDCTPPEECINYLLLNKLSGKSATRKQCDNQSTPWLLEPRGTQNILTKRGETHVSKCLQEDTVVER
jgi:hypothetical protein